METNLDPLDDLDSAEVCDSPTMVDAAAQWLRKTGVHYEVAASARPDSVVGVTHERCSRCNGTGRYIRPSSLGHDCFACHGTGKGRSLNPANVKARARAAEKRVATAQSIAAQAASFLTANPDIAKWFADNQNYGFAQSLQGNLRRYGKLSVGQVAVIRRNISDSVARALARAEERKAREVNVSGEGFTKLLACFQAALASGLKHPALTFERLCFKNAKKYPGSLYVTAGREFGSPFYGRIAPDGTFDPRRETPAEIIEEIKRIGADPFGEAVAHGKRTGNCCCCSRELTNQESIDLGIGPICRKKWGM